MFDLVIRGGTVVEERFVREASVCVSGSEVARLDTEVARPQGKAEIDARGCLVLPGGVDPHVHIAWPYGDAVTSDSYHSASVAALHGGTTTIIDFAYPRAGMSAPAYLQARRREAETGVIADFGLHTVLVGSREAPGPTEEELEALVRAGSTSWKVYLTYRHRGIMSDDAGLVRFLEAAAKLGAVVCVHAENGVIADARGQALGDEGTVDDFRAHYRQKPWWVEAEAVQRCIFLAGVHGSMLHFKHLSTGAAVEMVRAAVRRGDAVSAETCPHFLCLSEGETTPEEGVLFLCSPPLRTPIDREALWAALAAEEGLSCVGSDHCDFTKAQKLGNAADFRRVPNGLPGVETRLFLLWEEGVVKRGFSPSWIARVVAANPARIFGMYPKKGTIRPGADADLVVFDPRPRWRIVPDVLHMKADWSPYTGREVSGRVRAVVRRGEVVLEAGAVVAEPGSGLYIKRGRARGGANGET